MGRHPGQARHQGAKGAQGITTKVASGYQGSGAAPLAAPTAREGCHYTCGAGGWRPPHSQSPRPHHPRCVPAAPPPPPPPFTCPQEPAWKPDAYEAEAEAPEKDAAWVEARGAEELEEGEDEPALADDRFLAEYRCAVGVWLAG